MTVAALTAWSLASAVAAQTLPPSTDTDLLVPPDLRAGAHPAPAPAPARWRVVKPPAAPAPKAPTATAHPRASPEHPVDVGVVMRGGSATPKLYSPQGDTQAVRESGSAFGAGMRIGF